MLTESGKPWRSTIAMIFMPFPRLVSDLGASALRHHESCVDEAFFFVEHAAFAQFSLAIRSMRMPRRTSSGAAPGLKENGDEPFCSIGWHCGREHVPLRGAPVLMYIQSEEPGVSSHPACGQAAFVPQCSLRVAMAILLPLQIAQPNLFSLIARIDKKPCSNFEIGSRHRLIRPAALGLTAEAPTMRSF